MGGGSRYTRLINWKILVIDLVAMNLVFWGLFLLQVHFGKEVWSYRPLCLALILTLSFLLSIVSGKMVFLERGVRPEAVLANVFRIVLKFAAYSVFTLVVLKFRISSSRWLLLMYIITFAVVSVVHLYARGLLRSRRMNSGSRFSVVIVGITDATRKLCTYFAGSISMGVDLIGYFNEEEDMELSRICRYLGKNEDAVSYMEENEKPNQVFCGFVNTSSPTASAIMKWCRCNVVLFSVVPVVPDYINNKIFLQEIGGVYTFAFMNDPLSDPVRKALKRIFDIAVSGIFLCTLYPFIWAFVAIGTKLTSKGPILFRQKRTGLDGKEFTCLKFRSMRVNAQADTLQATEHDPRKTGFGDFIRKTSLDEFPQFINVFRGDMSIVGPRPHMVMHTEEYSALIDKYMVRHFVKPGITGWAQVTGYRGETRTLEQMEGRIKADIWYIENWSFWLDMVILYKTFVQVFVKGDEQAY